jgi:tRNA (guanine37-N1)-methyltransferase
VPEVLLSGHHEAIRAWRLKQSLGRTWERRPDLLQDRELSQEERELLAAYRRERMSDRGIGNRKHNKPRASGGALRCT